MPTPLPTHTAAPTTPATVATPPTHTPSASPTVPDALTPTATPTLLATSTVTVPPTASRTNTPIPTPTRTATRTSTATPTDGPDEAPVVTSIRCNGSTACLLSLDEAFEVEFSFEDADGDAESWTMTAERDDGEIFELGGGVYTPPFAFGTTTVPFDGFECALGNCIATDWFFTVVVTDVQGHESEPASVAISVRGSE